MKLWLVTQNVNTGYDTYDSMVVAAVDEESARTMHPSDCAQWSATKGCWVWTEMQICYDSGTWANPDKVSVQYLGTTDRDIEGVILASFNAG